MWYLLFCITMCTLYEQLYNDDANQLGVPGKEPAEGHWSYVEKWFTFALIWTVCGTADESGRTMFDTIVLAERSKSRSGL